MKRHLLIALLAAVTLGLGACGDDKQDKQAASKTGTTTEKTEKKGMVDTMKDKTKETFDAAKKMVEESKEKADKDLKDKDTK